jgi:tRNA (guanine37-N1)-methyltransferase
MVIVDAVTRLIPGVVGSPESLIEESHKNPGYLEYPHYTRPAEFNGWQVPEVLLSGDHAKIENWRQKNAIKRSS